LIRGDSRIRVVVKEQVFTRKVRFGQTQSQIRHHAIDERVPDRHTVTPEDFSYQGRPVIKWLGAKLFMMAAAAVDSRSFTASYSLQPTSFQVRGIDVQVTMIEVKTSFVVEWWTQVAQIDASTGMYDYLRKRIILGPTPSQFHTTLDTQSWGRQIAKEEVPERYLTWPGQHAGPDQGAEMRFGLFENFPFGGDLDGGANLDPFVTHESIRNEPEGGDPGAA
jgi:hypothetical protein